jgi:hypothetical protein
MDKPSRPFVVASFAAVSRMAVRLAWPFEGRESPASATLFLEESVPMP